MNCTCDPYLGLTSEKLVLEGYRNWSAGIISRDQSHWQNAWKIYSQCLGIDEARLALNSLTEFTRTMGRCASCPLKTSPPHCRSLCRDEILILGLLSGLQHDEKTAVTLCLDGLICPMRHDEVLIAAENLATTLHALNKTLLPIPARTIKAILTHYTSTSTLQ